MKYQAALVIILVALAAFGLGRLSVIYGQKGELEIAYPPEEQAGAVLGAAAEGTYVASKTGSKYFLPWCGSVGQIKKENKIWFASKVDAEAAGYQPAGNCKGI